MSDIKTIKDVITKVPITFDEYVSDKYSQEIIDEIYERMNSPRFARCNLFIVLDFISYLIEEARYDNADCDEADCDEDDYDDDFVRCYYHGTEEWADMTVDEIKNCDYIPDNCKQELCNIIENQINETFVFDW